MDKENFIPQDPSYRFKIENPQKVLYTLSKIKSLIEKFNKNIKNIGSNPELLFLEVSSLFSYPKYSPHEEGISNLLKIAKTEEDFNLKNELSEEINTLYNQTYELLYYFQGVINESINIIKNLINNEKATEDVKKSIEKLEGKIKLFYQSGATSPQSIKPLYLDELISMLKALCSNDEKSKQIISHLKEDKEFQNLLENFPKINLDILSGDSKHHDNLYR